MFKALTIGFLLLAGYGFFTGLSGAAMLSLFWAAISYIASKKLGSVSNSDHDSTIAESEESQD